MHALSSRSDCVERSSISCVRHTRAAAPPPAPPQTPARQRAFLARAELSDGDSINYLFYQGGLSQKGMHLSLWLGEDSQ